MTCLAQPLCFIIIFNHLHLNEDLISGAVSLISSVHLPLLLYTNTLRGLGETISRITAVLWRLIFSVLHVNLCSFYLSIISTSDATFSEGVM